MNWLDDLMITFSVVAMNHLGLVDAIARTVKHRLPIVGCPRGMTFWTVLAHGIATIPAASASGVIEAVAVAFLAAWAAIWLELFMGFIDQLYLKAYEQIYPATDTTDADTLGAEDAVPDVRQRSASCDTVAASKESETI